MVAVRRNGHIQLLKLLVKEGPTSNQAKAAQFEIFYGELRMVLRYLATNPKVSLKSLDTLDEIYDDLAKQCKDDKVLLPEALYARAVIQETRIIKPEENWQAALDAYKLVADNHKDTALGKLARKRVDILSDKDKREKLLNIYRDLRIEFVREDHMPTFPPEWNPAQPPVPPVLPVPGPGGKDK